jgi:hypothetical protein
MDNIDPLTWLIGAKWDSITEEDAREALQSTYSVCAAVAKMGCNWRSFPRLLEKFPSLREDVDNQRARLVDLAQEKLAERIENGNMQAIKFTLETLGKNAGYSVEKEKPAGVNLVVFDHARAVASVAGGPECNRLPPGPNEDGSYGETVGEDVYGGDVRPRLRRPGGRGSVGGSDLPECEDAVEVR